MTISVAATERPVQTPDLQVAALVTSHGVAAQLRDATPNGAIHLCVRRHELLALARGRHLDAVITELRDVDGSSVAPTISRIRAHTPKVAIIAYLRLCSADARELIPLAKIGVTDCVFRDVDDDRMNLRRLMARAEHSQTRADVTSEAEAALPTPAATMVARCLALPAQDCNVEVLARSLGVHRKTLVNRMMASGCLPPSSMLSWSRLLLAARLLEDPWRSVDAISDEVGFSDAATLRAVLRRTTLLRPSEVRERGGLQFVLSLFKSALAASAATTLDTAK